MAKIGFIGLGRMGRPMAGNMQQKGFSLLVYDIAEAPWTLYAKPPISRTRACAE